MRLFRGIAILAVALLAPGLAVAQEHGHHAGHGGHEHGAAAAPDAAKAPDARDPVSLSPAELADIRRGAGWGLAKAAELNGVPGPAHLLELKDAIPLSGEQVAAVQALYESMRASAIAEGERLIALERRLDAAFRAGTVTEDSLKAMVADIAESRAALRYIHLSAHLATPDLLTPEQIARYAVLRGYAAE